MFVLRERLKPASELKSVSCGKLDDFDDILQRRNNYIGQVNNVACYFDKLTWRVGLRLKHHQSYCSSLFGCELWSLNNGAIEQFCVAWRNGLRRIMGLPYAAHCHLLPLLSNTLPIFNEICTRSAKFILFCLCNGLALVRTVANYGILARSNSFIGRMLMFLCNRFHFSAADFKFGHPSNTISRHHLDTSCVRWRFIYAVNFAAELLCLRNQSYTFTNDVVLNKEDLNDLLSVVLCE